MARGGGLLAGTLFNSLNPVLVMSSALPAALAAPPPLACSTEVCLKDVWESCVVCGVLSVCQILLDQA